MEFNYKMGMEYYQDVFQRETGLTNEEMRESMLAYAEMYRIRGDFSPVKSVVESLQEQNKKLVEWMRSIGHKNGITYNNITKGQCERVQNWRKDCTCGLDELIKEVNNAND